MQGACTRNAEFARRSLDKIRPAARNPSLFRGIKGPQRNRRNNSRRKITLVKTKLLIMQIHRIKSVADSIIIYPAGNIIFHRNGLLSNDGPRLPNPAFPGPETKLKILQPRLTMKETINSQNRFPSRNLHPRPPRTGPPH